MRKGCRQALLFGLTTGLLLSSAVRESTRGQMSERVPTTWMRKKVLVALTASLEIERDTAAVYDAASRTRFADIDLRQTLAEIQVQHEKHERAATDFLEHEGGSSREIIIARKNYSRMASLAGLLERLIKQEEQCIAAHERSQKRIRGPAAKADFETMVRDERGHVSKLKKMLGHSPNS